MKFSITAMIYGPEDVKVMAEGTAVIALVGVEGGVYAVDFGRRKINFMERKDFSKTVDFFRGFVNLKNVYTTPDFYSRNLKAKPNMKGVRYYPCGNITVYDAVMTQRNKKLIMEYLDTSKGEIAEHDHPDGCMEVYLSAEAPYFGEFCDFGETHKPFCKKTVVVKMYP